MLIHPTIERLQALHLAAMAHAFEQQRTSSQHADLSFDDRLGLLVEAEWTAREQRRLTQRLRHAKLRYPASLEDVDFTTPRGLTRDVVLSPGHGRVDSGPSQSLNHRADRDRQIVARIGLCRECLPAWVYRHLRAGAPPPARAGRQSRRWLLCPATRQARETAPARD